MDEATAYKWASQVLRDSAGMGIQLHHEQTLADRIASALVEATRESPPVVPVGFVVRKEPGSIRDGYALEWTYEWDGTPPDTDRIPAAVYRALAWAIERDERPPHAGDSVTDNATRERNDQ